MKLLAIAVLSIAASAYAQAPTKPALHRPPAPAANPSAPPSPQTPPQAITPPKTVASVSLELAESKRHDLQTQRAAFVADANAQIAKINDDISARDKEISEAAEEVKKENHWGPDVSYTPTFFAQDGREFPAHWQKVEPPAPKK